MKTITITDDEATVEARARALCKQRGENPDELVRYMRPGTNFIEDQPDPLWMEWIPEARATLEADRQRAVDEGVMERVQKALSDDFPTGAVENGREFMRRLEDDYDFQCEAGALSNCSQWQELRRCFDYMADALAALAAVKGTSDAS